MRNLPPISAARVSDGRVRAAGSPGFGGAGEHGVLGG